MITLPGFDVYAPACRILVKGGLLPPGALISISVDENLETPAKFDLTLNEVLDPKTRSFTWLDNPLISPGAEVEIHFGYAGKEGSGLKILMKGKIKALSPSFPLTGIPSMTVEGYDLSQLMQKKINQVIDEGVKYSDIARAMASLYQLDPQGIEDSVKIYDKVERREGEKDYDFLKRLAGEIGFEFFVREETLCFRSPKEKNIIKTFQFRKNFISFSPRLSTASLVSEVKVTGWNNKTKRAFQKSVKLVDLFKENDITLLEKLIKTSEGSEPKIIEDKAVNSEDEAMTIAEAELKRTNKNFIQGTLECIGDPELRPGRGIKIEGLGNLFSSNYYIIGARHTLDDNGYKTSLELRRIIP